MNLLSAIAKLLFSFQMSDPKRQDAMPSDHDVDIYKEQMAELRWRRDQDRNYLTIFVAVCAFSVPAFYVILSKQLEPHISVWLLLAPIPILVIVTAWSCIVKIDEEHKNYDLAARSVIRVLDRWGMIAETDEELLRNTHGEIKNNAVTPLYNFNLGIRKLGSGSGAAKSKTIIRVISGGILIMYILLGYTFGRPACVDSCSNGKIKSGTGTAIQPTAPSNMAPQNSKVETGQTKNN